MSLETRIADLAAAIGLDVKALFARGTAGVSVVTNISVVPAQFSQAVVIVANANVLAGSNVLVALAPNDDWDADDLADLSITAHANDDSIDFCLSRPGPIVGNFKIIYQLA